jgi:hypothetical protein
MLLRSSCLLIYIISLACNVKQTRLVAQCPSPRIVCKAAFLCLFPGLDVLRPSVVIISCPMHARVLRKSRVQGRVPGSGTCRSDQSFPGSGPVTATELRGPGFSWIFFSGCCSDCPSMEKNAGDARSLPPPTKNLKHIPPLPSLSPFFVPFFPSPPNLPLQLPAQPSPSLQFPNPTPQWPPPPPRARPMRCPSLTSRLVACASLLSPPILTHSPLSRCLSSPSSSRTPRWPRSW